MKKERERKKKDKVREGKGRDRQRQGQEPRVGRETKVDQQLEKKEWKEGWTARGMEKKNYKKAGRGKGKEEERGRGRSRGREQGRGGQRVHMLGGDGWACGVAARVLIPGRGAWWPLLIVRALCADGSRACW